MARIGNITIEGARIVFRNFRGEAGRFNDAGDRNFCVIIDPELASKLDKDGWNVKVLPPRDEGEEPVHYLPVAVSFDYYPPKVYMVLDHNKVVKLDEETIGELDNADIAYVDVIIRPYEWEMAGKSGVKAYLKTMYATINMDELEEKYMGGIDENEQTK